MVSKGISSQQAALIKVFTCVKGKAMLHHLQSLYLNESNEDVFKEMEQFDKIYRSSGHIGQSDMRLLAGSGAGLLHSAYL